MNPQEKNKQESQSLSQGIASPFLDETLFEEAPGTEGKQLLATLPADSPFGHALALDHPAPGRQPENLAAQATAEDYFTREQDLPPDEESDAFDNEDGYIEGEAEESFYDDGAVYPEGEAEEGFYDGGAVYPESGEEEGFYDAGAAYPEGEAEEGFYDDGEAYPEGEEDAGFYDDEAAYPGGEADGDVYEDGEEYFADEDETAAFEEAADADDERFISYDPWSEPETEVEEYTGTWRESTDEAADAAYEGETSFDLEDEDVEDELLELEKSLDLPADIAEFADDLGRKWAKRRGGSPPADKIADWLARDYQDTLAGARKRFGSDYGRYNVDAIGRAWMVSRENQMNFKTASWTDVKSLSNFRPPKHRVALVSSSLVKGSGKAPVAPIVVRFVKALRQRYRSSLSVTTYRGHGGGKFNDRGYSVDLFLSGRDARGFYPSEDAVRFLRVLDQAARAVHVEWRVIYNDFNVADTINRETGKKHVIFVGKARKRNNRPYNLNWHGPHPLILHFHLDLVPRAGAADTVPDAPSTGATIPRSTGRTGKPSAEQVRFAQRVLNAAEGERLDDDGILGRLTRRALARFRRKYKLGSGGRLDEETHLALVQRALEEIRQQSLFARLGVLDAATRDSLVGFKSAHGLGSSAAIDAATRKALTDTLAKQGTSVHGSPAGRTSSPRPLPSTLPDAVPGRLGSLVFRRHGRTVLRYAFTPEDLIWTARLISGEAGARDDLENRAVIAAMLNRFALFTHRVFRTFTDFIRAYSTPLQPVLRNKKVARHYMNDPRFVRLGGTYPGTDIPRGQLKRHIAIQKTPWHRLRPLARKIALEALTGNMPDTGIGLASEFASTWMLYGRRVGAANRTKTGWLEYTRKFKRSKGWRWIGHKPHLNQKRNAFFLDPRAAKMPADAVQVEPTA